MLFFSIVYFFKTISFVNFRIISELANFNIVSYKPKHTISIVDYTVYISIINGILPYLFIAFTVHIILTSTEF